MVGVNTLAWLLQNVLSGDAKMLYNLSELHNVSQTINITSSHFEDNTHLPDFCVITENTSPELALYLGGANNADKIKSFVVVC